MKVTVVVVGLDKWERFTLPMIMSVGDTNPEIKVTCVDNGSDPPYPPIPGVNMVRSEEKLSYAGGINLGIRKSSPSDWYIVINNDTLFHKPILHRFREISPQFLYGFYMWSTEVPWSYLSSWCYLLSNKVWQVVGEFDENCAPMYFEDADYCKRAMDAGFNLMLEDRGLWGIEHLNVGQERVEYMTKHNEQRERIRGYVINKHT